MTDENINDPKPSNTSTFKYGLNKVLAIDTNDMYANKVLNSNIFHVAALASLIPLGYAGYKNERFGRILSVLMIVYIIVIVFLMIGYSNDNSVTSNVGVLGFVMGLILVPATLFVLGSSYYFAYKEYKK